MACMQPTFTAAKLDRGVRNGKFRYQVLIAYDSWGYVGEICNFERADLLEIQEQ